MEYLINYGRLATMENVPYLGKWDHKRCASYQKKPNGFIKARVYEKGQLKEGDVSLQTTLATTPVVVAVSIVYGFYQYKSGVFNPRTWHTVPDHAVLAVGYGKLWNTDDGLYWKVINS